MRRGRRVPPTPSTAASATLGRITPRAVHAAASFGIVLALYWTYALLAVPLIEPPLGSAVDYRPPPPPPTTGQPEFAGLFQPGDWELNNPIKMISNKAVVLLQDYLVQQDGSVLLKPCTLIIASHDTDADRLRHGTVVQIPEGAELLFDKPFDLRQFKMSRLMRGRLHGRVTVRNQGKQPDGADALWIETRDVEMVDRDVRTPHEVEFRFGPNYGRGREMHMRLKPRDTPGADDDLAGMESFEIKVVEQLHLDLGRIGTTQAPDAARAAAAPAAAQPMPIEVKCRGPFRCDMLQQVATFEDQVDLLRLHPSGPSDRLCCELLSLFFTGGGKAGGKQGGYQAQRVEARGNPAVLTAPSDNMYARGERLEYDLQNNAVTVQADQEAVLQQNANELHARALHYEAAPPGHVLGRMVSQGPGWIRAQGAQLAGQQPPATSQPPLEARWNGELTIRPQDGKHVITLGGGASLKSAETGALDAQQIQFWLVEQPDPKSGQLRPQPDRMLAQGNVHANTPQFSAAVDQMDVRFEAATLSLQERAGVTRPAAPGDGGPALQLVRYPGVDVPPAFAPPALVPPANVSQWRGTPVGGPVNLPPPQISPTSPMPMVRPAMLPGRPVAADAAARQQHLEISGRVLEAKVLRREPTNEISELTVIDNVRFRETQTAQPNEEPVLVTGTRLHVTDANLPSAAATVVGTPARFEGRGLRLSGPNINLNRGQNRLWVTGPGQMEVPVDRDLQGQPLAGPQQLHVQWQDGMAFDGRSAQFDTFVIARGTSQTLRTATLIVRFQQPIRFTDPKPQQPRLEEVLCRGGAYLENRSLDQSQQPSSYDRMEVSDLAINMITGAVTAGGPGWLVSVRRNSGTPGMFPGAGPLAGAAPRTATPVALPGRPDRLVCLHLKFQGPMSGNIQRRHLTFNDRVRAAYAPVNSWADTLESDDPDVLGPDGVILHCDQLSVDDMTPRGGAAAMELLAAGNVVTESTIFTARSNRLSYAQAKDLMILEGDGRSDAELYRQPDGPGRPASKAAAQKIYFWPKTRAAKVEGVRSLQMNQFQPNGPWQSGLPGTPAPPVTVAPASPATTRPMLPPR
jgi:lipopolysaccharide export system protein LptA